MDAPVHCKVEPRRCHSPSAEGRGNIGPDVLARLALGSALACALGGAPAAAQSIEPRSYAPAPVGTNFLILAAAKARGPLETDPALPLSDIDLHVEGVVLGYQRSLNLLGKSAKVDFVAPYGHLSGDATFLGVPVTRRVTGFSDPAARLTVLLHGAPAMGVQQFLAYRQDWIIGASVQMSIPAGKYDRDKLLNLGSHRWSVKPELGISKSWGAVTFETATGVTFFTANRAFLGDHERTQKPIFSAQTHLIYNVAPGAWVAANLSYFTGGASSIDGVDKGGLERNWRAGLIGAVPLNRQISLKLNGSKGVSQRTGAKFNLYGAALQYRWGAGI
jgi:hypothetical protein